MSKKTPMSVLEILNAGFSTDEIKKMEEESKKPLKETIKKVGEKKEGVSVSQENKKPLKQKTEALNGVTKAKNVVNEVIEKEKNENIEFVKPVLLIKGKEESKYTRRTFYLEKEIVSELDAMSEQTGVSRGIIVKEALKYYFSLVEIEKEE